LVKTAPKTNWAVPKPTPKSTGLGRDTSREDDAHAIAMAREVMDKLRWDTVPAAAAFAEPLFDEQELMGIVPADEREPYDVREVIARLVDGSDFLEFKAELRRRDDVWPRPRAGPSGRHSGKQRPDTAHRLHQGRAVHPAV